MLESDTSAVAISRSIADEVSNGERSKRDRQPSATDASSEVEEVNDDNSNQARRRVMWSQGIAFLLGFALLVYVIRRVGVEPIFAALNQIGFGFFFLLAISGSRHIFRTLSMCTAVGYKDRRFTFRQALAARLGGESVTFLTFTGPLLGEATKAALLRRSVPLTRGVPAIVVDNLLYNVSVALFILVGACVMLLSYPLPVVVRYVLLLIALGAGGGLMLIALAARRRLKPLTWIIDTLASKHRRLVFLSKKREQVHNLETHVYEFYKHRRAAFLLMLAFNFTAHATSVLEVYVTLRLLNFHAQVAASLIIESLTKVINFTFGFVPATIGVYEGGTEIILRTLGYAAATGVTLALVRKASILVWTSVGLSILVWRGVPSAFRRVVSRHPNLQKGMDNLVLSNIAHRPARTLVSVLGIAVGVLLIVFTTGLAHGVLRERGRREAGIGAEILMRPSGSTGLGVTQGITLDEKLADEIRTIEGVRTAVPFWQSTTSSDSGFGVRSVEGINFDEYAKLANLRIVEGRALGSTGDEAIVDSRWKEERKAEVGQTLQLFEREFRVVGVYEPPGGGRIKIPLQTMQEQMGGEGRATTLLVACTDPAQQEGVAARISARFPDYQLIYTRDLQELYATGTPALNTFINVIVAVAAAISMLVILLAMYTTVTERTKQIGILKSLGMSNGAIAWTVEQEAILISVLGAVAGLVLTYVTRFVVTRLTSLTIDIEWQWVGVALLIGLFGGTVGALYPAMRAARQDAVEALSYE